MNIYRVVMGADDELVGYARTRTEAQTIVKNTAAPEIHTVQLWSIPIDSESIVGYINGKDPVESGGVNVKLLQEWDVTKRGGLKEIEKDD